MSIKNRGVVASLWSLMLPGMFLFFVLLIQFHQENLRRSEIKNLSTQSMRQAFMILEKELVHVSDQNKQSLCQTEEPPSICTSNNPFDFLNEQDKADAIIKTHPEIWQEVKKFILFQDPKQQMELNDITVEYPYFPDDPWDFCGVNMKIEVIYTPSFFLQNIFPEMYSKVMTQSYLPLE